MNGVRHGSSPTGQGGLALVVVLWVIALLSGIALTLNSGMRMELGQVQRQQQALHLQNAMTSAVHYALLRLSADALSERWQLDGTLHEWQLDDIQLRIRLSSEQLRVNINRASKALLLETLGAIEELNDEQRDQLSDIIIDWRDVDQETQLHGWEDDQYREAGRPLGAKDQLFDDLQELRQLPGVDQGLASKLAILFTIRGGGGRNSRYSAQMLRVWQQDKVTATEEDAATRDDWQEGLDPAELMAGPQMGVIRVEVSAQSSSGARQAMRLLLDNRAAGNRPPRLVERAVLYE